jgi:hypothetical protein
MGAHRLSRQAFFDWCGHRRGSELVERHSPAQFPRSGRRRCQTGTADYQTGTADYLCKSCGSGNSRRFFHTCWQFLFNTWLLEQCPPERKSSGVSDPEPDGHSCQRTLLGWWIYSLLSSTNAKLGGSELLCPECRVG